MNSGTYSTKLTSTIFRLVIGLFIFGISQAAIAGLSVTAGSQSVYYYEPGQLTVSAFATDTSGTITKIEIYQDGVLIGTRIGSTRFYNLPVTNLPAGFYTFYAMVYDDQNLIATSNLLKLKINPPVACPITNGTGQKQPDGSCKVVSCNTNYHNDSNSCQPNTQACTIVNGQGQQTWNGTDYGTCQVITCDAAYHNENNSCQADVHACTIANGQGQQTWNGTDYGTCQVIACEAAYHNDNNSCQPNVQACTIANGQGQQTWNGSSFDPCQVISCDATYHNESNSCMADVRSCTVINGQGQQTWNGTDYGSCQVTTCDSGFKNKNNLCIAKMVGPGVGDITQVPVPTAVEGITVWSEQGAGTGTTYYVSPNGNDANDGLSAATPWQTLTKVMATTFYGGDSVLLEGGQNFTGCLAFTNAKIQSTSAQPFTLGSYGNGRFIFTANCTGTKKGAIKIAGINGFILRDAIIKGNSGGTWYGVWITNPNSVVTDGVSVRNSDISGFYASGADFGGEIFITGYPGAGLNHINILGNTLHGDNPNSFDDNGVSGWGNGPNITNILYQGNHIYNIGGRANGTPGVLGSGIEANGVGSGVIQYNIAHDLSGNVNTCGGGSGFWAVSSKNVTIQHNEAYFVRPVPYTKGCDWDGYDLDIGVTNSKVQYNYSHDNFGAGYLAFVSGTWGDNVYRYNVSVNDALFGTSAWGGITVTNNSSTRRIDIYNNTIYNTGVGARGNQGLPIVLNTATMTGTMANNIFYSSVNFGGKSWVFNTNNHKNNSMVIVNNNYYGSLPLMLEWGGVRYYSLATWQAASLQDPQAKNFNPSFTTGPNGITYQLSPNSQLLGAGLDLTQSPYGLSVGIEDYFDNAIPHSLGTGYNIGADGGNGQ